MADIFKVGQGDTVPELSYELYPQANLTGATVVFTMVREEEEELVRNGQAEPVIDERAAVIAQVNPGVVRFDWLTGDTAAFGSYLGQFRVTFSNGKIGSYPNTDEKILIRITPRL